LLPSAQQTGSIPSVLDRLIDPVSESAPEALWLGPNELADRVRRDVQDLLNTLAAPPEGIEEFPEVATSILAFGLPEMPTHDLATRKDRDALATHIEKVIRTFETRLTDVRVTLGKDVGKSRQELPFTIEARLRIPGLPAIRLKSSLELATRQFEIKGEAL
jgi:type VI secretion system protein ImpF